MWRKVCDGAKRGKEGQRRNGGRMVLEGKMSKGSDKRYTVQLWHTLHHIILPYNVPNIVPYTVPYHVPYIVPYDTPYTM